MKVCPAPSSRQTSPVGSRHVEAQRQFEGILVLVAYEDVPHTSLKVAEARGVRFDYLTTNSLHEPRADESQFFAELSYSFSDRLGVIVASPLLLRDNFAYAVAQGPSSRPTISGQPVEMFFRDRTSRTVETEVPVPDLFRMEAR